MRNIGEGVFAADETIVVVGRDDIDRLKALAPASRRRRVRVCAHASTQDAVQEMLIVLDGATYVRPHRHLNKSESFHLVEGRLTVVIFQEDGAVRAAFPLGEYGSGRPFFYRLAEPAYHTVLLESPCAVIHETTNGPFNRADSEFAAWAPAEEDEEAGRNYLRELARSLAVRLPGA